MDSRLSHAAALERADHQFGVIFWSDDALKAERVVFRRYNNGVDLWFVGLRRAAGAGGSVEPMCFLEQKRCLSVQVRLETLQQGLLKRKVKATKPTGQIGVTRS